MAVTSSGQISLQDIMTELGISGETAMNDADVRGLIGKSSAAQNSISEYYGASSAPTYTRIASGTTDRDFNRILWNGSLLVVAGEKGRMYTSTNGTSWTVRSSGISYRKSIRGLGWSGSKWMVAGNSGAVSTSSNGTSWGWPGANPGTSTIYGVASSGSRWLAAGSGSGTYWYSNNDGASWSSSSVSGYSFYRGVIWDGSRFILHGSGGNISYSTSGTGSWTTQNVGHSNILMAVSYVNGIYIATSSGGNISTSTNLTSWTQRTSGMSGQLYEAQYDGTYYIIGAQSGVTGGVEVNQILVSTDAVTWDVVFSPVGGTAENIYSITNMGSQLVAGGGDGFIMTVES